MSRDAQNQAKTTFGESQDLLNSSKLNQAGLLDQLTPIYTQEATNPVGLTPQEKANAATASEESTGGAVAGAEGQGNLTAARTRNSGGFDVAQDESVRNAQRTNASNALSVENEDTALKTAEQQEGISGLAGLEGQSNADVLSSLGLSNQSTGALTSAGNNGWFQNFLATVNAFKPGGSVGGGNPAGLTFGG